MIPSALMGASTCVLTIIYAACCISFLQSVSQGGDAGAISALGVELGRCADTIQQLQRGEATTAEAVRFLRLEWSRSVDESAAALSELRQTCEDAQAKGIAAPGQSATEGEGSSSSMAGAGGALDLGVSSALRAELKVCTSQHSGVRSALRLIIRCF